MSQARSSVARQISQLLLGGLLWWVALTAVGNAAFEVGCTLPFDDIKGDDPISFCANHGSATEAEQQAQNRAKNNFCATGTATNLTYQDFLRLQKAADDAEIEFGSHARVPKDRSALKNIITSASGKHVGEGSIVRYVGFVSHPRNSNKSKGEAVNCKRGGAESNDIHIDLLRSPDEPACRSITVEIVPHFRPPAWEVEILKLPQFVGRPMRFTGHLFFDASHRPCKNDNDKVNPKRASIWEIHPVYAIDVCKFKSLKSCPAGKQAVWTPLSDLVNTPDEDEDDDE